MHASVTNCNIPACHAYVYAHRIPWFDVGSFVSRGFRPGCSAASKQRGTDVAALRWRIYIIGEGYTLGLLVFLGRVYLRRTAKAIHLTSLLVVKS